MERRRAEPPETYRADTDTAVEGETEPRRRDRGQRSTEASERPRPIRSRARLSPAVPDRLRRADRGRLVRGAMKLGYAI